MIEGNVSVFLDALGARESEAPLARALEFVGGGYEVDAFDDDGGGSATYLLMPQRGVEFLLTDGALSSVFVFATVNDEHAVYGGWPTLVHGVGATASPAEVVQALGEPDRSGTTYLCYAVGSGFVQFDFDGEALMMAVIMRQVPSAGR